MWASSKSHLPHQGVDSRYSASIICAARHTSSNSASPAAGPAPTPQTRTNKQPATAGKPSSAPRTQMGYTEPTPNQLTVLLRTKS
jgi:hypothetical protein